MSDLDFSEIKKALSSAGFVAIAAGIQVLEERAECLQHSLATAERERDNADELLQKMEVYYKQLREKHEAFADEVIALITTEQESMCRLYSKHEYGINKVCNRLKIFVGDLLKAHNPSRGES